MLPEAPPDGAQAWRCVALLTVVFTLAVLVILISIPSRSSIDSSHRRTREGFWTNTVGGLLNRMLSLSEYPESVQSSCMHVFTSCIVPLMGPSPSQYPAGTQPCSLMVDDHTPVELSFVMGSPLRMAARVYVEPLDAVTGSPAPRDSWLRSLGALGVVSGVEHNDLSWSHICLKTLTVDASRVSGLVQVPRTQFAFGVEFRAAGGVGTKAWFAPALRAAFSRELPLDLMTNCMQRLGIVESWEHLLEFIRSRPPSHQVTPLFLAVGTVPSTMNSVKVYFRTQATSLVELIDYLTFGNHLDAAAERDVVEAVDSLRRLWQLLFPSVGDDVSLPSRAPEHFATGFLIYYDLSPRTPYSLPKVNINVKHYCANDQAVASAIAQYYDYVGCHDLGDSYERNLRSLYKHTALESHSGIHTYIGVGLKASGARVTLYYSPEAFASQVES